MALEMGLWRADGYKLARVFEQVTAAVGLDD